MAHINRFLVFITTAFFLAVPAMAGRRPVIPPMSPVVAKLTIPETRVLPGVPFDMWIDVRNPSSATVGVGLCADMVVRPETGDPFTIEFVGEEAPPYPTVLTDAENQPISYLTMRPRETQTLTLPIEQELDGPRYFADERLSKPGRYGISLHFDYCWPGLVTPQKMLLPPEFLGAVTTNEVIVERLTPTGSDAAVWQRMQEVTDGHWVSISWSAKRAGMIVVDEILTKYSNSNYYPYAVLASSFGVLNPVRHTRAADALKRFPSSPVKEWLEVQAWLNAEIGPVRTMYQEKAKAAKRPTTRRSTFGREDLPPPPCPPTDDCID